ncbi:hypothetical protein GALMADRAFT_142508 [Galerina marginata CBS 339.88]|uniref:Protein phosphatase n=1 Tax=Galerina marginata (strain CBS 339.88) TaxID=685588 RepID=A0A067SP98_GALM3|nr:hypothetical protein GALMADRAFT_142508 [Galerina marginata CBS 339.88]
MRQRLYILPRVRSNSLSTLAVAPPTSTSRPVLSSPPRLPSEAPKQSQHSQLALSQPTPGLHPPLFPTPPLSPNFNPVPAPASSALAPSNPDTPRAPKRQRLQYQLDVGAYGIPKHRRAFHSSAAYPSTALSVQVGEDAYFVRDNAMGIADGVGGWARCGPQSPHHPTPSALFSRRLMHFCAAEIEAMDDNPTARPPTTHFSFQHHLKPRSLSPPPQSPPSIFSFSELEDSLHSSLEELSEGIDVLNILERAYDSTVKSHLAPSTPTPTPLTTGSSTALLAVLDHPPSSTGPLPQSPEAPHKNYAAGSVYTPDVLPPRSEPESDLKDTHPAAEPYDAVIRIAHLGDCMGMLVRGDKIAWRSDEMWWGYNHPLQLGPPPPPSSTPSPPNHPNTNTLPVKPHTFTLPVRADDILILASDGLSDNLWDEDVLDEVLKFRQNASWGLSAQSLPPEKDKDSEHPPESAHAQLLRRKAFAGMLSEALCSRAKRVSEIRPRSGSSSPRKRPASPQPSFSVIAEEDTEKDMSSSSQPSVSFVTSEEGKDEIYDDFEVPFARRAKLAGKVFRGGKHDDISVIVAVISPSPSTPTFSEPPKATPSPTPSVKPTPNTSRSPSIDPTRPRTRL